MPERLEQYHFEVPPHLIAQHPLPERDQSRLMLLRRNRDGHRHLKFSQLPGLLPQGCLLVVNDTRVLPHRLPGSLPSGGRLEALLLSEESPGCWRAMVRNARRLKPGLELDFAGGALPARAVERLAEGQWLLEFSEPGTLAERLERHGLPPLPPYLRRDLSDVGQGEADRQAYQTIFASRGGAIAAPTAAFHFTPRVLEGLERRGIGRVALTLHVGLGTFAKIECEDPADHRMHPEWYDITPEAAVRLSQARTQGRPVVAVGTTSVRALESWAAAGCPPGYAGWSELFIRPGHRFRVVDGLITNFHQPRTTLLLLVAAFHGRERILAAYREAIAQEYRLFSFGDGMAILP